MSIPRDIREGTWQTTRYIRLTWRAMLVSNESLQPLNPDVYLNHVSPAEAHAIDIRRDLSFIVLGVSDVDEPSRPHSCVNLVLSR